MKTLNVPVVSLLFLFLTPFSAARAQIPADPDALTAEEQAQADFCAANITEKTYAPDKAAKCLEYLHADSDRLLEKLKKTHQATLVLILKYQNIFKELGEFYSAAPSVCRTRNKLVLTLERVCAVCGLSPALGPQPDKFYPWVEEYAKERLPATQEAALDWDKLDETYRVTLASYSYTAENWKEKTVQGRMATITADDIINSKTPTFFDSDRSGCTAIKLTLDDLLRYYLDPAMSARYTAHQAKLKTAITAAAAAGQASAARTGAIGARLAKIAPEAGGDQFASLGRTFDGSALSGGDPGGGTGIKPGVAPAGKSAFTLSPDDMVKLSGRLESSIMGEKGPDGAYSGGELKGTKTGDKLLAFYNQKNDKGEFMNKLDFAVKRLESQKTGADYCPTRCAGGCGGCTVGQVRLNASLAETWMKKNGVTAETLLDPRNDYFLKRLARYAAPTVVHEETHQQKNREDLDAKIKETYKLDDEVRTFGAQSLFLKEKLADPATEKLYMKDLRPFDDTVLQRIETGGYANLKKYVRYYDLHGLEGASSQEFTRFEGMLKESGLRTTDTAFVDPPDSPSCWEGNPGVCSNAQLKAMTDKVFPWYQASVKEQRENITALNSEMNRLNAIDSSKRYKKLASPVAGF